MSAEGGKSSNLVVPNEKMPMSPDSVTLRSENGSLSKKEKEDNLAADKAFTKDPETQTAQTDNESRYVTGLKLYLIFIGMLMSIFLVALDQTIVATAIPVIASQFNALTEVTWLASAYFLTQAGFMLGYGQLLTVASTKWVYLWAVVLFEIGSAICGAAPNMKVLIFGRAFAGVGAAGIFVAALAILAQITRIEQRPLLFGMFGAVFALSSVIGPLLGGAFTDHVSWRWCFYINLPFGAITLASIVFFIDSDLCTPQSVDSSIPLLTRLKGMDYLGTVICVGMVTALLLPLQWGGVTREWDDRLVIIIFCVFALLVILFVGYEWFRGNAAILPLHMFKNRTQVGACLEAFFVMLCLLVGAYYLPLYYQSSMEHTATQSGIDILPFMISVVVAAGLSGGVINTTGRPLPFLIGSPLLASLGSGLLFWNLTNEPNTKHLIGFQILLGLGVGGALQNAIIVIQAEYNDRPPLVPQSTSMVNFTQLVGGIIGIAIAGTIFANQLRDGVKTHAPGLDPLLAEAVRHSVAVIRTLEGEQKAGVVKAYAEALGYVFILGIPSGVLASLAGCLIRNFDLKNMNLEPAMAGA